LTPTNHHQTDGYLDAYRDEVTRELRSAYTRRPSGHPLRGALARTMVRLGVSLMPEQPSVVDDRIFILPRPDRAADLRRAA
jgi:hypothetical protein